MFKSSKPANSVRHAEASEGFALGLKWSLFFLVSFFILGYSATISILLGSIGGFAAGFLSTWWHAKGDIFTPNSDNLPEPEPTDVKPAKGLSRSDRWRRPRNRSRKSFSSITWPFRRRNRR